MLRLWVAAEDDVLRDEPVDNHTRFPVVTCTTYGQHYYIAFLEDFTFTGNQPSGDQAGWMKDHARRFRLRALMARGIKSSTRSIGDLVAWLDDLLEDDEILSRALIPEVWQVARREGACGRHGPNCLPIAFWKSGRISPNALGRLALPSTLAPAPATRPPGALPSLKQVLQRAPLHRMLLGVGLLELLQVDQIPANASAAVSVVAFFNGS